MRAWSDFPADNADRSVRAWLRRNFEASGLPMLADAREVNAVADRIMATIDDRSRAILEAVDRRYDEAEMNRLAAMMDEVLKGVPVQYATGWTDFRGLRIMCGPEALIPRPETEELVEWFVAGVEAGIAQGPSNPAHERVRVLDVGTGSGCIALAIKALRPEWEVFGLDISAGALELAERNAAALDLEVHWIRADALDQDRTGWPAPLNGIVSNPPYIPHSESGLMEEHVTRHEPGIALFVPDDDPLVFYRSLCGAALELLPSGGCLAAECHHALTRDVAECWQLEVGETAVLSDLQGAERAVRLNRP